ncbi:multiple coagulation factor deficiency protein 2 homolog [Phlebotomus argentipes]|uniref:multiple coagulation factor deficiency protein 2 homolog n=1 Tax=Phlebotomus argentipes TaxID=94469 RepID=UPI002892E1AD|nr:multiple coagulation factor deficiency protein 2 homolog [Phlebotomus argentipes]
MIWLYGAIFLAVGSNLRLVSAKRGPHHPRGERGAYKEKLDVHLTHDDEHIKEDLKAINLQHKQVEHMSLEEKQFYQFKLHDDDNNDMLDGLEILHSANQHENTFHRIDRDKYYDATEYELQHIVDIIDTFMKDADLDDDGFINYQEYSTALNRVEVDANPEPPLLDDH